MNFLRNPGSLRPSSYQVMSSSDPSGPGDHPALTAAQVGSGFSRRDRPERGPAGTCPGKWRPPADQGHGPSRAEGRRRPESPSIFTRAGLQNQRLQESGVHWTRTMRSSTTPAQTCPHSPASRGAPHLLLLGRDPLRQMGSPVTLGPPHPQASPSVTPSCHPGWGRWGDPKSRSRAVVSAQGPPLRPSEAGLPQSCDPQGRAGEASAPRQLRLLTDARRAPRASGARRDSDPNSSALRAS